MALDLKSEWSDMYEDRNGVLYMKNFIGGEWGFFGDDFTEVVNPFDRSVIAKVPMLSEAAIDRSINAAVAGTKGIRDIPAIERIEFFRKVSALLRENRGSIVRTLIQEAGKPTHNAEAEVNATINRMEMVAEEAHKIYGEYIPGDWSEDTMQKFAIVLREPVGVVLAIAPFNYPLFITAGKVIPALLAGNSVIVKLPSADPIAFLLFTRLIQEACLPPGALNVITTRGTTLDKFVDDPRIGAVTFTGSTAVGKQIASLAGMKSLHLELGGKGAALVLADADLDLAAKKVLHGSFNFAGQRCDAISRVIVEESVADKFVGRVVELAKETKWGDPRTEGTVVGPLIDDEAISRVDSLVKDAVDRGAKLLVGGKAEGHVFQPTVLDRIPREARIMKEETFGPVVSIARTPTMDSAIEMANDSVYGLDSCVFTNDIYKAWKVSKMLIDGEVTVNDAPAHGVGYFPFGGTKESGIGREGIGYSIEEMTKLKTVVFNLAPADLGKTRKLCL